MDNDAPNPGQSPERPFSPSPKILKREAFEASQEARDVIATAREKAAGILADAMGERATILERARDEGRAAGLAEWNQILEQANRRAEDVAKNWEESMVRLSVRVAEKIIGEEVRLRPETIVAIVQEALKSIRPGKHLTIRISDSELQELRTRIDRLKESLSGSTEIEIVGSASIARGGCVIESDLGIVDAKLETQLKCLEDALVRGFGD